MNKYLIEILKIQSSVILPGLGALMVPSQKSGKIVFNQHLKFNDGSLARFIAEKEGIDEQESQNKVAKFVREIEAEIGKGNSYDMFEFGKFYKNKDGEVDFEMFKEDDGTASTEAKPEPKPEKAVTPPVTPKVETPKPKEKKEDSKKTAAKKSPKKPKEKETKDTEESKQSKNKFIPPVVEEVKEDLTKKIEAAEEKVKEKAESIEEKVADKTKVIEEKAEAVEKDAAKIVTEVKEKAEEKIDAIKDKVEKKVEEVKEKITDKSGKKDTTTPTNTDKEKPEDKQRKNTFIPPVDSDEKKEESNTKKAAVVAGSAAAATASTASKESKTVIEKTKETTVIKETVVKDEKKRKKWPLIILLLLLIGLAVAGYFFKDKIMAFFNDGDAVAADSTAVSDSTDENSTILPTEFDDTLSNENDTNEWTDSTAMDGDNSDGAIEDPVDNTEEPIEDPVEDVAPVVSGTNNGSYHLIGNSFGEEANAERYAQKMQEKGYPAKVLGRFDGLYMVSLKSYDSREAASQGRSSVTADAGSAWIFKYAK